MSKKDATAYAASLAATLMVAIVVFQAGDGSFGAVPADEIDAAATVRIHLDSLDDRFRQKCRNRCSCRLLVHR